jgi:hypothetical protein
MPPFAPGEDRSRLGRRGAYVILEAPQRRHGSIRVDGWPHKLFAQVRYVGRYLQRDDFAHAAILKRPFFKLNEFGESSGLLDDFHCFDLEFGSVGETRGCSEKLICAALDRLSQRGTKLLQKSREIGSRYIFRIEMRSVELVGDFEKIAVIHGINVRHLVHATSPFPGPSKTMAMMAGVDLAVLWEEPVDAFCDFKTGPHENSGARSDSQNHQRRWSGRRVKRASKGCDGSSGRGSFDRLDNHLKKPRRRKAP